MTKFYKNMSFDKALEKALWYCSYQERCMFDMEERFKSWNVHIADRDKIIDHLIENNYLNEQRYIEAFVRGKFVIKKWGKLKITAELYQKKISGKQVKEAISKEIDDEQYLSTLKELIEKKQIQLIEDDKNKRREKLFRYLISKGYESDLIFKLL